MTAAKLKCKQVLFLQGSEAKTWLELMASRGAATMLEEMSRQGLLELPDDPMAIEHEYPARYETEIVSRHVVSYSYGLTYVGVDYLEERVEEEYAKPFRHLRDPVAEVIEEHMRLEDEERIENEQATQG